MRLRPLTLADLPSLLDVQQAGAVLALAHIFPQDEHPFPRDEIEARWTEEIADPAIATFAIEDDDGAVAGFAATAADQFLHFGTALDTWGTGLATAAHDEVLARMAAAGVVTARLWVFEENRRARRFYEKYGWRPSGQRRTTAFPPHPALVEYRRELAAPTGL